VTASIRPYDQADEASILELALRAWAPTYASMETILGKEISLRLHGEDWRTYQAASVRDVINDETMQVWVSVEEHDQVVGFVAAKIVDPDRRIGEIVMLAVDPAASGQGRGTALTEHATTWLREQGMRVAMIGTGGDPGHARPTDLREGAVHLDADGPLFQSPLIMDTSRG
jgi:ribosomal protein S18 acetylase RimI-like enzyme